MQQVLSVQHGVSHAALPDGYRPIVTAFRQDLQECSCVEGRNVAVASLKSRQEQAGGQAAATSAAPAAILPTFVPSIIATSILIWSPGAPRHQAEVTIHGQAIQEFGVVIDTLTCPTR